MNKTELVATVAEKAKLPKKDAEKTIKASIDAISEELIRGGKVQLVDFGTSKASERTAREGGSPKTGKMMTIGTPKAPKFKVGKALKDEVNR